MLNIFLVQPTLITMYGLVLQYILWLNMLLLRNFSLFQKTIVHCSRCKCSWSASASASCMGVWNNSNFNERCTGVASNTIRTWGRLSHYIFTQVQGPDHFWWPVWQVEAKNSLYFKNKIQHLITSPRFWNFMWFIGSWGK